jgi:trigger factor
VITVELKMTSGDAVLKEEQNVRIPVRPQVIDGVVLEKLGEVLTGAKVGDVKTISGQIPDSYIKEEFRGKQADLTITVRQIQRMELPEVNEEFAKHFGSETVAELRESVKADMESRIGEQVRQAMSDQICQHLLDKTAFELPERLSERQINQVTMRRMLELYQQGVPPAEVEKILDELKTKARADAVTSMKLAFVFEKLAEKFKVEVTEEEINAQIMAIARRQGRRFDRVRDELIKQNAVDNLYLRIRDDKIVTKLLEQAKVTEGPAAEKPKGETAGEKESGGEKKAKAKTEAKAQEAPAEGSAPPPAKPKRSPPKKAKKASDDAADAT